MCKFISAFLFLIIGLFCCISIAGENNSNSYLQEYQNLVNQTNAKAAAMAKENQETVAHNKLEKEQQQAAAAAPPAQNQTSSAQPNNPWVKPNPWAVPPAQTPAGNSTNQTTIVPPPNIFAPPKAPANK